MKVNSTNKHWRLHNPQDPKHFPEADIGDGDVFIEGSSGSVQQMPISQVRKLIKKGTIVAWSTTAIDVGRE